MLRNDSNNTELISSKEEEIQIITKNAYLYAVGVAIIAFIILLNHAWLFFLFETLGMKCRVFFIAAIYEKVRIIMLWVLRSFTYAISTYVYCYFCTKYLV